MPSLRKADAGNDPGRVPATLARQAGTRFGGAGNGGRQIQKRRHPTKAGSWMLSFDNPVSGVLPGNAVLRGDVPGRFRAAPGDFRPRFPALRPAKTKESRNSRAAIADFRRPAAFFVVRVHRRAPRRRIPALRVPRRPAGRFLSVKLQQIKQLVNIPRAHHDQSVARTQFPVQIPGNP